MKVTLGHYRHIGPSQRFCSIETLHAWMKGNGAKFAQDRLCDVLSQIRNYESTQDSEKFIFAD